MKKLSFSLIPMIILSGISDIFAQQKSSTSHFNFYSACEHYYKQQPNIPVEKRSNYKQFKRWESFMAPRVYPTGNFEPDILWRTYQSEKQKWDQRTSRAYGAWTPLGPAVMPSGGGGIGRVNCIVIDPGNSNTIWVGSPDGGLWKSTDAGGSWTAIDDLLPNLGVTEIAINPQNTNIMYIGTGDGFGYVVSAEFWGGTYSNGVMKSTDGGNTWTTTGLNWQLTQANQINALIISPTNPDVLLAGCSSGIWKTTDAGVTWSLKQSGDFRGLKFKPGDASVVYGGSNNIYRSIDGGDTWTQVTFSLFSNGLAFGVSPSAPNIVYALGTNNTVYKSTNSGQTWDNGSTVFGNFSYGWYTTDIAVSPTDANTITTTGIDVAKSVNGGTSWFTITDWQGWPNSNYIHADNRSLVYDPNNANILYAGNDGGIFKSSDGGSTWTDISAGMQIMQLYRLGLSETDQDLLYCGAQDNGANQFNGTSWAMVVFADGMECAVDPTNSQIVYASTQNGSMKKSTNGGISFSNVTPNTSADWITTFELDPSNPQTIYYGGTELFKSINGAASWNPITSGQSGGETITWITVADSDPNTIYFSHGSKLYGGTVGLYKTNNGGSSWTSISSGLPVTSGWVTYIEVDNTDPNLLWVTFSGYTLVDKVYESIDGGQSWNSISGSLPNIPVNTIVHDHTTEDGLYIGTDFGVYFKNDTMNDWILFNNGLPNVIVSELEIQYTAKKLRAATYGRGIWETDLYDGVNAAYNQMPETQLTLKVYPNPAKKIVTLDINTTSKGNPHLILTDLNGKEVLSTNISDEGPHIVKQIDLGKFSKGVYNVVISIDGKRVQKQIMIE